MEQIINEQTNIIPYVNYREVNDKVFIDSDNNSFIIITDAHLWTRDRKSSIDYRRECFHFFYQIEDIIDEELEKGRNVYLIFLGDVFHRSYKYLDEAMQDVDYFHYLNTKVHGIFSVVGNHEMTYSKNNPFWFLKNKIESKYLRVYTKLEPKGINNIIMTPDYIVCGNLCFQLNHYSLSVRPCTSDNEYVLSHNTITTSSIMNNHPEVWNAGYIDFEEERTFEGFKRVYLGHQHELYGTYVYKNVKGGETIVRNLGSLGRPSSKEIRNDFLKRAIPVIHTMNGNVDSVTEVEIELLAREECVNEAVVERQRKMRRIRKAKEIIKNYNPVADRPIEEVRETFRNFTTATNIINCCLQDKVDENYAKIADYLSKM